MQLIIPLTIFTVITDLNCSQTTREPLKDDVTPKSIINQSQKEDLISGTADGNTNLKDLWNHKPVSHKSQAASKQDSQLVNFRAPHSVTKLTKTAYGFDPYFSKGYFEPFERRPKLVTLVAFRKNGLVPRKTIKNSDESTLEVAELQSPFNGISNFWMDAAAENP